MSGGGKEPAYPGLSSAVAFMLSVWLGVYGLLPSTPIAGPSTQDDLARLLELAGTPVRPVPTAQPASADFFRPAPLTPSVAREAACQAEAGTTPPGAVETVAARKSGPAEPLLPLLAQGEGRPHRPTEHTPRDTRLLCASVCSAVLETTTTTTKRYRPEGLRARIVAFALVAAVTFLAVFALGTSYSPAPTTLPPPPAVLPSSLDSSHQPSREAGHNATGHRCVGPHCLQPATATRHVNHTHARAPSGGVTL